MAQSVVTASLLSGTSPHPSHNRLGSPHPSPRCRAIGRAARDEDRSVPAARQATCDECQLHRGDCGLGALHHSIREALFPQSLSRFPSKARTIKRKSATVDFFCPITGRGREATHTAKTGSGAHRTQGYSRALRYPLANQVPGNMSTATDEQRATLHAAIERKYRTLHTVAYFLLRNRDPRLIEYADDLVHETVIRIMCMPIPYDPQKGSVVSLCKAWMRLTLNAFILRRVYSGNLHSGRELHKELKESKGYAGRIQELSIQDQSEYCYQEEDFLTLEDKLAAPTELPGFQNITSPIIDGVSRYIRILEFKLGSRKKAKDFEVWDHERRILSALRLLFIDRINFSVEWELYKPPNGRQKQLSIRAVARRFDLSHDLLTNRFNLARKNIRRDLVPARGCSVTPDPVYAR